MKKAVGEYQHVTLMQKTIDIGKRSDISWISSETTDRYNHIVIANGMNAEAYQANPIVTLNHDYSAAPIGRSIWQKQASNHKNVRGVQALTFYPERPDQFDGPWPPDEVFALISSGLLNAKSIGFLPLGVIHPTNPGDPFIITDWALIEYAVGVLPVNPDATIIRVNKTIKASTPPPVAVSLTSEQISEIIQNCLDKLLGRI